MKIKKIASNIFLIYIPVLFTVVMTLIPFLFALSTSFKTQSEVLSSKVTYLPQHLNFQNYIKTWTSNKFSVYFSNSLVIAIIAVFIILILTISNGYALSRYNFKGKKLFTYLLLGTQMMPVILFIIPLFLVFKTVHLINTSVSVIIVFIVLQAPFNTILMRGFVNNIPKEVDEAAMVDGCGRMNIIFKIITPALLPGIVATSAFAFIGCWNEFIVPFTFIQTATKFTLPVGLKYMIGEYSVDYPSLAAGSIIALIPPIALFAFIQKYLIAGLSSGSVKG